MDRAAVAKWLDGYIDAWKSNDRAQIASLFTDDVTYRYYPYEEPDRGIDKVVDGWLEDPDAPGTWEASYEPVAVEGNVVVAKGTSRYLPGPETPERIFHNVFLMTFDDDGRCRDFVEYYMKQPSAGN
jgi:hypothetical protein